MGKSYYHTCPDCGANLDPGERCTDCTDNNIQEVTHDGNQIDP